MRFSSPNPTFSACCGCWETFIPLGLRGRDSPMAWLRQYQYNLHSPLQPGVVKALLLVLRSSAALALAAVLRTVHSHADCALASKRLATGLQINRLQTANLPPLASTQTVRRLQTSSRLHPFKTFADCCCKKKAATAAPFTHKPQGVACRRDSAAE